MNTVLKIIKTRQHLFISLKTPTTVLKILIPLLIKLDFKCMRFKGENYQHKRSNSNMAMF